MFSLLQRDNMDFTAHRMLQKSNKTIFSKRSRVERQNPHGLRARGIAATTDKGPLRNTDVARVKSWCGFSQSLFRTLGGGTSAATPVPVVALVGSLIGPLFTKNGLLPCMYCYAVRALRTWRPAHLCELFRSAAACARVLSASGAVEWQTILGLAKGRFQIRMLT